MGEYAIRKSDGQKIKIGTCEEMYYLRYSDRDKVNALSGNVDPMDEKEVQELRWRLPFPDEDGIKPGEYRDYDRAVPLHGFNPGNADDPGMFRARSKYGLFVDLPCHHGEALPEIPGVSAFWNGKSCAYELRFLKFIDGEPWGVYGCIECGKQWMAPLIEIISHLTAYEVQDLKRRLVEWYATPQPLCAEVA